MNIFGFKITMSHFTIWFQKNWSIKNLRGKLKIYMKIDLYFFEGLVDIDICQEIYLVEGIKVVFDSLSSQYSIQISWASKVWPLTYYL